MSATGHDTIYDWRCVGRREGDVLHCDVPQPSEDVRPILFRFISRRDLTPLPPQTHL